MSESKHFNTSINSMHEMSESWVKYYKSSIMPLQKKMEEMGSYYKEFSIKLQSAAKINFDRITENLRTLANLGWYTSMETSLNFPNIVIEKLINEGEESANKIMIEYLDGELEFIKEIIRSHFKHRQAAIFQAITAHQEEKYFLSIPVFFSQTEGICNELTGIRFFVKVYRKKRYRTEELTANLRDGSILTLIMEPLKVEGVMRKNQVQGEPIGINRHDVLHGQSIDYGNRVNSYKALSLLFYIISILTYKSEEESSR